MVPQETVREKRRNEWTVIERYRAERVDLCRPYVRMDCRVG